jgi:benzoyl-CoA reductase/2-hydroxyglutaryl-CoA dehydratase subunit BcrC/BadD/HgdB
MRIGNPAAAAKKSLWKEFDRFAEKAVYQIHTAKAKGIPIAGIYCVFAPGELIRAAGAVPIGLCGKEEGPIPAAETDLPAALCPLIKSSYGYALTKACPFFEAADFIIGETTCDGKKKMFELLGQRKPVHLMHLPYNQTLPAAVAYWHEEMRRLQSRLEEQTDCCVSNDALREQIRLHNRMRRAFQRLIRRNRPGRKPVAGMRFLPVLESKGFVVDMPGFVDMLERLAAEWEAEAGDEDPFLSAAPRVLLTGTPLGRGSEKVLRLLENAGATVVAMENCTGIKSIYRLTEEDSEEPLLAIARYYLDTPCACMTPNQGRIELILHLIRELGANAVVDLSWQCCHPYQIEAVPLKQALHAHGDLPLLHISTDYSGSDQGQLEVRIEAFLELVREKIM